MMLGTGQNLSGNRAGTIDRGRSLFSKKRVAKTFFRKKRGGDFFSKKKKGRRLFLPRGKSLRTFSVRDFSFLKGVSGFGVRDF